VSFSIIIQVFVKLSNNPDSAALNAAMASYQYYQCCLYNINNIVKLPAPIMQQLDKALRLNPSEPDARNLLIDIKSSGQEPDYTPPPTYTPTITPAITPTHTPLPNS
jgi:hypothetical protein